MDALLLFLALTIVVGSFSVGVLEIISVEVIIDVDGTLLDVD